MARAGTARAPRFTSAGGILERQPHLPPSLFPLCRARSRNQRAGLDESPVRQAVLGARIKWGPAGGARTVPDFPSSLAERLTNRGIQASVKGISVR